MQIFSNTCEYESNPVRPTRNFTAAILEIPLCGARSDQSGHRKV